MPEFSAAIHLRVCESSQAEGPRRTDAPSEPASSEASSVLPTPTASPAPRRGQLSSALLSRFTQAAPSSNASASLPSPVSESPEAAGAGKSDARLVQSPLSAQPSSNMHAESNSTTVAASSDLVLSERAEAMLRVHRPSQTLFETSKHSRIFEALNPQPLAFRTARERAEQSANDEDEVVDRHRTRFLEARFEAMQAHAEGELPPEAEEGNGAPAQEEPFDPKNLPEFDEEMKSYLADMRRQRAEAAETRRSTMRETHAARAAAEQARLAKEIEEIKAKEAEMARQKEMRENVVHEAAQRVQQLEFGFRFAD
eukprot:m.125849 g.125849  ORF g.125849 m.125849 type:complete len:312 (-) comp14680_c4_seq3:385-1320(-)